MATNNGGGVVGVCGEGVRGGAGGGIGGGFKGCGGQICLYFNGCALAWLSLSLRESAHMPVINEEALGFRRHRCKQ